MSNEDFYTREAAYWKGEAFRLQDILNQIIDVAKMRRDSGVPPEPPVGTKFFHGTVIVWEHTHAGWSCLDQTCRHCPTDWQEAYEFGIDRKSTRVLPDQ